ncbi:MAG: plasmid pRiA4b ORF-3 family protein [Bacteroidales bacterium]|nr:plasmid pRiA4b ORF-3 family protein [Bacteroidales bacterium]
MYYYKFRVYYDEVEDFVRDIEILSNDNFENFHKFLLGAIGLDGQELASFYICDSKWNKQKEISLMDMGDDSEKEDPQYEEDDEFSLRSKLPISVMHDSLLKDFISDPHQHIMYEYDFLNPKVFYIELLKVLQVEEGIEYPRCTHKEKELPKVLKQNPLPNPEDGYVEDIEEEDDLDDGFNEGFEDDLDLSGFSELSDF